MYILHDVSVHVAGMVHVIMISRKWQTVYITHVRTYSSVSVFSLPGDSLFFRRCHARRCKRLRAASWEQRYLDSMVVLCILLLDSLKTTTLSLKKWWLEDFRILPIQIHHSCSIFVIFVFWGEIILGLNLEYIPGLYDQLVSRLSREIVIQPLWQRQQPWANDDPCEADKKQQMLH